MIKSIQYLEFELTGYFSDYRKIIISDRSYSLIKSEIPYCPGTNEQGILIARKTGDLINKLNSINLLKWNREYVNKNVMDGTQWELKLKYNDNKRRKIIYGSNAYPYSEEFSTEYSERFISLLKAIDIIIGTPFFI